MPALWQSCQCGTLKRLCEPSAAPPPPFVFAHRTRSVWHYSLSRWHSLATTQRRWRPLSAVCRQLPVPGATQMHCSGHSLRPWQMGSWGKAVCQGNNTCCVCVVYVCVVGGGGNFCSKLPVQSSAQDWIPLMRELACWRFDADPRLWARCSSCTSSSRPTRPPPAATATARYADLLVLSTLSV
jgi:hypothetical protein